MPVLIQSDNIYLEYSNQAGNSTPIIRDVSIHLHTNEIVAVIGPSGCGKSTLLRVLAGIELPTRGIISYTGFDTRPPIPLVLQTPALLPWRSVHENLQLAYEVERRQKLDAQIKEILEAVGMAEFADYPPRKLSGGMSARVSIARALLSKSQVVMFDEAFSGLDEQTKLKMAKLFRKNVFAAGKSAFVITHDVREAVEIADRVIILSKGPSMIVGEVIVKAASSGREDSVSIDNMDSIAAKIRSLISEVWI